MWKLKTNFFQLEKLKIKYLVQLIKFKNQNPIFL